MKVLLLLLFEQEMKIFSEAILKRSTPIYRTSNSKNAVAVVVALTLKGSFRSLDVIICIVA